MRKGCNHTATTKTQHVMIKELAKQSRTYRRFFEDKTIEHSQIVELVELARFCPSARNLQPLKFFISSDPQTNSRIFPTLAWAGYLKDWSGPDKGERPSAYIVMLEDETLSQSTQWDQGIMAQTIMLGAAEKGLGGCMIASVKRDELSAVLDLPPHLKIVLVLAIGYPKENVQITNVVDGNIKYFRDSNGNHFVPKRSLDELIVK